MHQESFLSQDLCQAWGQTPAAQNPLSLGELPPNFPQPAAAADLKEQFLCSQHRLQSCLPKFHNTH